MNLYIKGKPWTITVDDRIPWMSIDRPFFTFSPDKWWPTLIDKAFAKYRGSYAHAMGGNPDLVLQTISGAPTFEY